MNAKWFVSRKFQTGLAVSWALFLAVLTLSLNLFWNPFYLNKITYNLDPDSSVFIYGGKLVSGGALPYRDFWDHKPPAVFYVDAAVIALGGTSPWAFWWTNVAWIILTTVVLYLILRRLGGGLAAMIGSGAFLIALMYPNYFSGGNMPELYGTLPQTLTIGSAYLLFSTGKSRWAWTAGILTALAFLFKQTLISLGIGLFLALCILGLQTRAWRKILPRLAEFSLGVLLPLALVVIVWAAAGSLPDLWDAVVLYNLSYVNGGVTPASLESTFHILFLEFPLMPLMLAALAGLVVFLLNYRRGFHAQAEGSEPAGYPQWLAGVSARDAVFLSIFCALPFSLIFINLGGRNYLHYYTSLLPVIAAAGACLFMQLAGGRWTRPAVQWPRILLAAGIMVLGAVWIVDAYQHEKPQMGFRNSIAHFSSTDIPISSNARYVLENTGPNDPILVWGNNIGLYLETDRRNPSRYLYPQPLFLPKSGPGSRFDEFLADLRRDPPALIFGLDSNSSDLPTVPASGAGLCPQCSPEALAGMEQLRQFVDANYVLVSVDPSNHAYQLLR